MKPANRSARAPTSRTAPVPTRPASPGSAGNAPQQARSKARVARILSVASELVRSQGVNGLTMSAVATKAKIPIGSVYQYFPSKSELVHRLFLDRLSSYHDVMTGVMHRAHSPKDCAAALRHAVFRIYEANRADPLMQDIWAGVQADREIRDLHALDNQFYHEVLTQLARKAETPLSAGPLKLRVIIANEMLDACIRLAISFSRPYARRLLNDAVGVAVKALGFKV
jgi:AcrR family transcriptional regulator